MANPTTREDIASGHPSGDDRFALVDEHLKSTNNAQDQLIEALHVAQEAFGHLSKDILVYLARALHLPPSLVYGGATFYHLFSFEAHGNHSCTVCTGTACFIRGADSIVQSVAARYAIAAGATSGDGKLTLETARCLGPCGLAPVVALDGSVFGPASDASTLTRITEQLHQDRDR
jgi:bidirectional [NiFe] hydrogenase diaphorase subunit